MTTGRKKGNNKKFPLRRYILAFWGIVILLLLISGGLMFGIVNEYFGKLPSTAKLENPKTPLASEVYSADGNVIGKFFNENRSRATFDELSPHLINALIATEDIRYYQHSGIDFRGIARVLVKTILLNQESSGGGSTITQQLAKNLFPRKKFDTFLKLMIRKLKEWVIAVRLERYYTKEEILTMYMNTVSFGSNAFGIKSASKTFFNTTSDSLKVEEAATLVGLLKATYYYSPVYNPQNSKQRRNVVMHQMSKYDYITKSQYDSLSELPLKVNYKVESHNRGIARYFREFIRQKVGQWCDKQGYNLYTDGLRIYTTINSRMQTYAEQAIRKHMKDLQKQFFEHWEGHGPPWGNFDEIITQGVKRSARYHQLKARGISMDSIMQVFKKPVKTTVFSYQGPVDTVMSPLDSVRYNKHYLHAGMLAMDPHTGHIKSWVGGVDFRFFKYDHVRPRAKRQVGSTFKPFVYTVAIMNGFSPCFKVPNVPVVFEDYDNWSPKNASGEYGGMETLKMGLAHSINCVTANIIKQVGPESVVQLVRKMGIKSPMKPYPSISLGTMDISVYEMVSAFNVYANKGIWYEPVFLTRIEDKNGNVLKKYVPKSVEVLNETTNYIMLDMLQTVINKGTGMRLRFRYGFEREIGGKTGTTQNNSDGWFIGFTPDISAGIWVGGEDRAVHFRSTYLGQGASMALPIWAYFMKKALDDPHLILNTKRFKKPGEELPVEIDCSKYEQKEDQPNLEMPTP